MPNTVLKNCASPTALLFNKTELSDVSYKIHLKMALKRINRPLIWIQISKTPCNDANLT